VAKIQSAGGTTGKETIYVDVDDEITSLIEKVQDAKGKIVALVLPKRATVLQSIVNMKLLKRAAETAEKNLVLVTTEAGLLPLAGSVGLHVASTPTSKPVIPPAPQGPDDSPEDVDEPLAVTEDEPEAEFDPGAAAHTAVGDLAGAAATSKLAAAPADEILEVGDEDETPAPVTSKPKTNKKLRVPNFDSFRKRLLLGGFILVLLIVGWIYAFVVMPRATVVIHTDTSTVSTNLDLTLNTAAKTLDPDSGVVPAVAQNTQKSYSQQVPATGQQNNGDRATGSVTLNATRCAPSIGAPDDVPSGTGVSSGGLTYITQEGASFAYNGNDAHGCNYYKAGPVDIVALNGGTQYNTSGTATFAVSGQSDVTGKGSAGGGTDNIVKVVAQGDIDSAKSKISAESTSIVKNDLEAVLQGKGLLPVAATFVAGDPQVTSSAQAGDPADTVTVTEVITYTMLGVKQSDLVTLVKANVNKQIDKSKQSILDDGVAKASFTAQSPPTPTAAPIAMHAKSVAGPQLNTAALQKQAAGKKSGDIKSFIKQTPGVTDVEVHYRPFWVTATPKNADKITIQIDKTGNS
jgi:hypothetical protein